MLGVIALLLLPDRPESTHFLNGSERVIAIERMNRSISGDTGAIINKGDFYPAVLSRESSLII